MTSEPMLLAANDVAPASRGILGADRQALRDAVRELEGPSFIARLSAAAGRPIEMLGRALPERATELISEATAKALRQGLRYIIKTVPRGTKDAETGRHRTLATLSGAIGGAFGMAAIPIELPVSTTIMLRAIVRIAQSEGEDLDDPETALACLQVFALAGRTGSVHLHESGYFAVRAALARSVTEVARQVAQRGVLDESASAVIRLISQIGSRFGVAVSQKVAAQALPVLGALSGAAINAAFTAHFQTMARAHFTVRRLERAHGKAAVRAAYLQIQAEEGF
ncbi:MAG TPA: EcsC family protein [Geminicoccus sp.]|jgi:hypothetical protein|uniref:EcsC family protein n=1 Tax=Geminicoccus sp. TaxID=2024832 RepID=UPI002E2F12CA|nr:EcsC family protein [Geminicoccus sp.]HEX2527221.1 EcsC family protein [Geminicoccus sp.]